MGKLFELRQRIGAVENIRTITRTLATVAAARLSRTRRRAAGMGAYARSLREILWAQQSYLTGAGFSLGAFSALLRPRAPVRSVALLTITADRGMCGSYNLEACRTGLEFWGNRGRAGQQVRFILIGRRGASYFAARHADILHQESWPRAGVTPDLVEQLLGRVLGYYRSGMVDEVHAAYTVFHSPIHREPSIVRILPVELPAAQEPGVSPAGEPLYWHYEPTRRELIEELVAVYLRVQLYDVLLESYASEYGARMITMEEASERADRGLAGYRVLYNRLRREAITIDLLSALMAGRAAEASPIEAGP